jgi:hypothetical protein
MNHKHPWYFPSIGRHAHNPKSTQFLVLDRGVGVWNTVQELRSLDLPGYAPYRPIVPSRLCCLMYGGVLARLELVAWLYVHNPYIRLIDPTQPLLAARDRREKA